MRSLAVQCLCTIQALCLLAIVFASIARAETASWYGAESGLRTASGERFNPNAMTAAHRTLPFGTLVRVCRGGARGLADGATANEKCVTVRINDRGPFIRGRDIDLSQGAARAVGCAGVCKVSIEPLWWANCNPRTHACGVR
jgi:rare lipoprotein A